MEAASRAWVVLACVVAALTLAPAAHALPGDPPVTSIAPADGATVAADPAGIPVSFGCPGYRQDVYGDPEDPITDFGDASDYDVVFSPVADVDSSGVLANRYPSAPDIAANGDVCTAELDTNDSASSPEAVGGRVFWQASRSCAGCGGGQVEVGPIRSFTVRPPRIASTIVVPRRLYAGYVAKVVVRARADLAGAPVTLQRRVGKRWRTIGREELAGETEFFVKLPRGRQRLRAVITTTGSSSAGRVRTVSVRPDRGRTTSARDDGRYAQAKGSKISFSVARGGRVLRNFSASVVALCFGSTVEENRFMILFAGIDSVRVAPDGSVTGRLRTKSGGVEVELTGRLRKRRFVGETSIAVSASRCTGTRDLVAQRSRPRRR